MAIPNQTITIKDPGLGLIEIAASTPLLCGISSSGTATQLISVQSPTDAVTLLGQGPLVEDVCRVLSEAGGPVLACRLTGSVAGTNSAVTATATGTGTITLAGAPYDSYNAEVRITAAGTVGVGKFVYALDAHNIVDANGVAFAPTWSSELTIPAGGTYLIPNTNVTMTFVPGAGPSFFAVGDKHTWTSTEPGYVTADLDAAGDVFRLLANQWRFIGLSGMAPTAAGAATLAGGLGAELASEQTLFRYARGFMDAAGDTTSNTITAFAAVEDRRLALAYGRCVRTTLKPFAGWGTPKRAVVGEFMARAAREQISTHLGRVATGALSGVRYISHDEFHNSVMDAAKFSTLRTWPGRAGFYITRGNLRSPPGSDFKYTHNGFVMDVACSTVASALSEFANKSFRVTSTGTMDPKDAKDIEAAVLRQLRAQLTEPLNAEGKRGHVSALNFTVDLTNNVLLTGQVNTEVAIRPLGYGEYFTTQIGFAADVGA
jgi:hypothetical protein